MSSKRFEDLFPTYRSYAEHLITEDLTSWLVTLLESPELISETEYANRVERAQELASALGLHWENIQAYLPNREYLAARIAAR